MSAAYLQLSGGLQARVALVFLKSVHPLYSRISLNIVRETALYLDLFALLPYVNGSTLSLFSLDSGKESSLNLAHSFPKFSQCCLLSAFDTLLFPNLSEEVWEYSFLSRSLTQLSSLSTRRDWPALLAYRTQVYVFGGFRVTSNEKLGTQRWEMLANSQFHHFHTNPCPVREVIYLCDQRTSERGTEVYSIATNSFRQIRGPSHFELSSSVSLAVEDTLVWLTCHGQVIVQQGEDTGRMVPTHETAFLLTQLCPVQYRDCFYWRELYGRVRCWKPSCLSLT